MIVVGGTYVEFTDVPGSRTVAGSGLRAAGAIAATGEVELVSAVDDSMSDEASVVATGLGVALRPVRRDQPVAFNYFTPISSPSIDGPAATYDGVLEADAETLLCFGMIEHGPRRLRGRTCVIDPQRPRDLAGLSLDGIEADRIGLVCNRSEIRAIGGSDDLLMSARAASTRLDAQAVVVKRGALGCSVLINNSLVDVGPHPTERVWPIGSGDVFASAFSYAWGNGADAVDAARIGSAAASWWCGSRNPTVPKSVLDGRGEEVPGIGPAVDLVDHPVVYLAAPFFCLSQRWLVETSREALRGLGAEVFSPFHDVGDGGDEVAAADLDGLRTCGSVLALVDGFDGGTLYECGWAHRAEIPVVAFGADDQAEGAKMLVGSGAELHSDFSSSVYRAVWAAMGVNLVGRRVSGFEFQ